MYILKCGVSLDSPPNLIQAFDNERDALNRIATAIHSNAYKRIEIDVVPDENSNRYYWQTNEVDTVRHGHWIDNADSYICSECRYETNNPNKNPCGPGRCPRCFAKMDVVKPTCESCDHYCSGAGDFECTGCVDHSSWEGRK